MEITAQLVKELRDKTSLGMMECKKALKETDGDVEKAIELLRKKGALKAESKSGRATSEGVVGSYVHLGGKIGVLVEVNCETDFVAKNEGFLTMVKDIAMHIAAAAPQFVRREDVPEDFLAKEKEIMMSQPDLANKPDDLKEKIVTGRLGKLYSQICLLEQNYVKNPDQTINDFVKESIAKLGENISIKRFTRYAVGEE